MYIFELCTKLYLNFLKEKKEPPEQKEYQKCEHIFLSIDSESQYLACSKCGFVIENPHKKNPFV